MRLPVAENFEVALDQIYNEVWVEKNITLSILRLDAIHPVLSGNKLFKLYYFLKKAITSGKKIITFGGSYSNHLAATAWACRYNNVPCIGIVRGEKPALISSTLSFCAQQGMQLEFIGRSNYAEKEKQQFLEELELNFGSHVLIPEGGFSNKGVKGAAKIYTYLKGKKATHICCPVGTAATFAGLIISANTSQEILGFSALKIPDFEKRIIHLLGNNTFKNYSLITDYHFGGYAKKNRELINFMNLFYKNHNIPLDFVYTGKMMYGIIDMIKQDKFPENSSIVCIHTGGLQGNSSLGDELIY